MRGYAPWGRSLMTKTGRSARRITRSAVVPTNMSAGLPVRSEDDERRVTSFGFLDYAEVGLAEHNFPKRCLLS